MLHRAFLLPRILGGAGGTGGQHGAGSGRRLRPRTGAAGPAGARPAWPRAAGPGPGGAYHARDIGELLGRINDYVGAEGRFTRWWKAACSALPLPELAGIEIVDTPGMNDPVVSRTDKTRTYMAQCDVVFFLSPSGRLLDDSDQQLPGRPVARQGRQAPGAGGLAVRRRHPGRRL